MEKFLHFAAEYGPKLLDLVLVAVILAAITWAAAQFGMDVIHPQLVAAGLSAASAQVATVAATLAVALGIDWFATGVLVNV